MKGSLSIVRACHRRTCLAEENMAWPQTTRDFGNLQKFGNLLFSHRSLHSGHYYSVKHASPQNP